MPRAQRFLARALSFREPFETEISSLMLEEKEPKAATKEVVDAKQKAAAQEVVKPKQPRKWWTPSRRRQPKNWWMPSRKAALLTKKRPAAAFTERPKYVKMFYKRSRARAIRRHWGNKGQVFQFKEASWSEERLNDLASKALENK